MASGGSKTREAAAIGTSAAAEEPARSLIPEAFRPDEPGKATFQARNPATGSLLPTVACSASSDEVRAAGDAAWAAFQDALRMDDEQRALMLEEIANAVRLLGDDLTKLATKETGFSAVRIVAERERLVATLRMFAGLVRARPWSDPSIDTAEPSRRPLPKPDLRRVRRPLGPVVVLGPANQPLTAGCLGADAASVLAAGCPIVAVAHHEHPMTDAMIAGAAIDACRHAGAPEGMVTLLHAAEDRVGGVVDELVEHHAIRGVAFTGRRRTADRIAQRVAAYAPGVRLHASIGTINPVFVLPGALESNTDGVAERLFRACTNVAGQTCTRPSVVVVPRGAPGQKFVGQLASLFDQLPASRMRSLRVRTSFLEELGRCLDTPGVRLEGGSHYAQEAEADGPATAHGCLLRCSAGVFADSRTLHDEMFGPVLLAVVADDEEDLLGAAASVGGALTASMWMSSSDSKLCHKLAAILEHRAGRLVFNASPTGLELCTSLVHAGPYPASLGEGRTAVGPAAATRWLRDVSYQNAPEALLPRELRTANPLEIPRIVNGELIDPTDADRDDEGDAGEAAGPSGDAARAA
ncbi:MAG: aldehyde dehydrogenase family protein [Planctomycetota bacterium]